MGRGISLSTDARWLKPEWPAPANVHAGTSLRMGGVSQPPYATLNLALHVGDDPAAVYKNRKRLGLPREPVWLQQVHGNTVINAADFSGRIPEADGAYSRQPGVICAVMTADCLPVLLCDRRGGGVAAVHAGWRGLLAGVIEAGVEKLAVAGDQLLAWLGPAIGPNAYEVGDEVRQAFVSRDASASLAFQPATAGRWWMDIYTLARQRLMQCGVEDIFGGDHCTCHEADKFYSYRRDGVTGRMVSVIWFE